MSEDRSKKKKKARELLDLEVREVSLVDRPAIRREFLVVKREHPNEKDTNMSVDFEGTKEQSQFFFEDEDAAQTISKADHIDEDVLKMFSPELVRAVASTIKGLKEATETYKGSDRAKVANAAKVLEGLLAIGSAKKAEDEEEDEDEEESKSKTKRKLKKETVKMDETAPAPQTPVTFSKRDDGSYDLTGVPNEMQATVTELCKRHDDAIEKAGKLEESLTAERDERLRRDFVEKAEKEYKNIPGTAAEVGLLLKALHDSNAEIAEKIESIFKSVNEQIAGSAVLEEIGSSSGESDSSAWGRISAQATEMMGTNGMTSHAQAVSKVLELNPTLYQQYLKEGGN